jgi:hypothetical protein
MALHLSSSVIVAVLLLAASFLGFAWFAFLAWYGLREEMDAKNEWTARNWRALVLCLTLSGGSLWVFVRVAVGGLLP